MGRTLLIALACVPLASVHGCVGDDPAGSTPSEDAGDAATIDAPNPNPNDGSPPADAGSDAPRRCDPAKVFGPPASIGKVSYGRVSPDESTLYLSARTDDGGVSVDFDIQFATRSDPTAPFGTVSPLAGNVNTAAIEQHPSVTSDLLNLYYDYLPALDGGTTIHRATRGSTQAVWTAGGAVGALNGSSGGNYPYVLPAHDVIYFALGGDLQRATGAGGNWNTPDPVQGASINTPAVEISPVVTPDELTLYFGSDRAGTDAGARYDIFVARRASKDLPFETASGVTELNTTTFQIPTWISGDGCILYMSQAVGSNIEVVVATRGK